MIATPKYIWCRFWSNEGNHVIEKYFDAQGVALGIYVRVGMTLPHHGRGFSMLDMLLGIWITENGRRNGARRRSLRPRCENGGDDAREAEHAEQIIRELTTSIAQKRFPAAFVRNFALATTVPAGVTK